ncbi:hypothetical protein [Crocinitomix algicola]|uniref:hypothetical protein n=1 Tax=Crocinitomix algicola TaxID=1740263 RepID=UPI00082BEB83|nr:hypothetical protein [Crocinitomix algicola]
MNATEKSNSEKKTLRTSNSKTYMALAAVGIVSFLLPWVSINLLFFNYSVSGFRLTQASTNLDQLNDLGGSYDGSLAYLIFLIVIPMLLSVALFLEYLNKKKMRLWLSIPSLFVLLTITTLAIIQMEGKGFFEIVSFGYYICLLSLIGLVIISIIDLSSGVNLKKGSRKIETDEEVL